MDALIHSTLRDGWWVSLRYSKGNTTARTAVPLKKLITLLCTGGGVITGRRTRGEHIKYSSYIH